jgi:hypothetical protein
VKPSKPSDWSRNRCPLTVIVGIPGGDLRPVGFVLGLATLPVRGDLVAIEREHPRAVVAGATSRNIPASRVFGSRGD